MSVTWESRSNGYRGKPDGLPSQIFKADGLSAEAKAAAKAKAQRYAGILEKQMNDAPRASISKFYVVSCNML